MKPGDGLFYFTVLALLWYDSGMPWWWFFGLLFVGGLVNAHHSERYVINGQRD